MSNLQANKVSAIRDRPNSSKFLMQQFVRRFLPQYVKDKLYQSRAKLRTTQRRMMFFLSLLSNYTYDCKRFVSSSSASGSVNTRTQLLALITMDYHRIEKGLALRAPRVGFGNKVIQRLLFNLSKYQEQYDFDESVQIALNALFAYYYFNLENGFKDEGLHETLLELSGRTCSLEKYTDQGGVIDITKQAILAAAPLNPKLFFHSRYSIRQFSTSEVDMDLIEQAVEMAQKTPSVCNRQSSKVYVFSKEDKQKALSFQNGNRGFGDQANKVLIVVSNLQCFTKIGERNQGWIDGGMYAMSLVYALHALGLGTCCLNWSVEYSVDQALKAATGIKNYEAVIMMIAVGHLPDELTVAQSPRKKVDEVLISV